MRLLQTLFMLNKKQTDHLALFFLEELESIIRFKIEFHISDYLTYPPEEDVSYWGIEPELDLLMHIDSAFTKKVYIKAAFLFNSVKETENLLSQALKLDARADTLVKKGGVRPEYSMSHLVAQNIKQEFQLENITNDIKIGLIQYISSLFTKVNKLTEKEIKCWVIDSMTNHLDKRILDIKHSFLQGNVSSNVPFLISDELIQVVHCCVQKQKLESITSTYSTEQDLKSSCLQFLIERLESFKKDLNVIYPNDLPTLSVSKDVKGNKYFKWLGWENYFLIQYYTQKASDNATEGIDYPDFVRLLSGKELKDGKTEWYGSKSVLNAFFKDLHLFPEYLEKEEAQPIIEPTRKSLNIHEVFYLPNTDPKHQSKAFSLPINPKDISGRDVKNQQIFKPKGENVVVKGANVNKLKSHQRLVLELLGIDLPQ